MKQFGKILKFELKGYLKNKVFVGVTIFLVVAIAVAMFIPNIISALKSGTTPSKDLPVMLVYAENDTLSETVKEYFTQAFTGYNVKTADGTLDERPEELPFDITADEIEISDADYAIWYMDCQDNPKKYEGKKVSFLALVYNPDKLKKGIMVPGRFAMTCCVEDVTFIGFKTKYDREDEIPHKSWINITAEVHVEFAKEYKGKGPVLYPISITPAEKPEDELVYFS
mgnify:CR=1 FL=1